MLILEKNSFEEDDFEGHSHEGESEGDEIWLISYSDLMTLLFGFFVLLYVFAKADQSSKEEMKEGISKSFAGSYVPPDSEVADEIKKLAEKIKDIPGLGQIEVTQPEDGLEITFRSALLFPQGRATMLDSARQSMKVLVDIVRANVQGAEIMVAGHTDDSPIKTLVYPSNWELSAARAATVVKEFEASHYPSHLLVAMGYGESRPAYVNRNSEGEPIAKNQEKNRRVVIKVVSPGVTKQPSPIMKTSSQKSPEGVKSPPAGPSIKAPGK